MKKHDDSFLDLVGRLAADEYNNQPPSNTLYPLVLQKAGLPQKGAVRRFPRALLVAALVGGALLIAAAAYYHVSDAFRGVLREQSPEGVSRPLSSMAPVVDRSGTLIQETDKDKGIEVTVRGVVGDANGFKILMDIVDPSGAPLAIEQIDGSLSRGDIGFGSMKMRTEDAVDSADFFSGLNQYDIFLTTGSSSSSAGYEMLDNNSADNKVTMLLTVEQEAAEQLVGKTLHLTLTNLMQAGKCRGAGVGMAQNDLYTLATAFPAVSDSDFRQNGYSQDASGNVEYSYELVTDSEKALPLASGLSGYTVTNAAIWNGNLYLRGTAPKPTGYQELFPNAELRNFETDEQFRWSGSGFDEVSGNSNLVSWTLVFADVPSAEALKGFELALDGGDENSMHPLREGQWSFEIPLDFENTTSIIRLDERFTVEGFTMQAKELTLSPYYMRLLTVVEPDSYAAMTHRENPIELDWSPIVSGETAWDKVESYALLTMKDGSTIRASVGGYMDDTETFSIGFDLPVVIDPAQIDSITFGDLTIHPNAT